MDKREKRDWTDWYMFGTICLTQEKGAPISEARPLTLRQSLELDYYLIEAMVRSLITADGQHWSYQV